MPENQNELNNAPQVDAIPEIGNDVAAQEAAVEHIEDIPPAATPAPPIPQTAAAVPTKPQPYENEEAQAAPHRKKEKRVPDTSVMKVRSYMGALLLLMIPIVNLIMIFQWAFSRNINRNKRNLGIASLLLLLLFIALFVSACVISKTQFGFDLIGYLWAFITGNLA